MATSELYESFPALELSPHRITSPEDDLYNRIAWAAGDPSRWWWPDSLFVGFWPPEAPRLETLAAFIAAFELLGYTVCEPSQPEAGWEKVALYQRQGAPTHASRQLPSGLWTSKLGSLEDIEHALAAIEGVVYGQVGVILKRPFGR